MGKCESWARVLVAGAIVALVGAAVPSAAVADASGITLQPAGQPVVQSGSTAEPAADLVITPPVPPPEVGLRSFAAPYASFPEGTHLVLTLEGSQGNNCITATDTIGFTGVPTITAYNSDGIAQPAGLGLGSSAQCKALKVPDLIDIEIESPTVSVTVTTVQYAIGPTVPAGPVYVTLEASCLGSPCNPTFDPVDVGCGDTLCSNASVEALPDLVPTAITPPLGSGDTVQLSAAIQNHGDGTSPAGTAVELVTPWTTVTTDIDPVAPGAAAEPSFSLSVPDSERGATVIVNVVVDPGGRVREKGLGGHSSRFEVSMPQPGAAVEPTTAPPVSGGGPIVTPTTAPPPTTTTTTTPRRGSGGGLGQNATIVGLGLASLALVAAAGFGINQWNDERKRRLKPDFHIRVAWCERRSLFASRPRLLQMHVGIDPSRRRVEWQKGLLP